MRVPLRISAQRAVIAPLLSALVAATAVVAPATTVTALAAPTGPTMVVSSKIFPSGDPVPGTLSATVNVAPGGSVALTAPGQVVGGSSARTFAFVFWNADLSVYATPAATFTAPSDTSTFAATAWYIETGGSCPGCPPGTGVTTFAFSLNKDKVVPNTPIASVTPSGAWSGAPSTTVSTTTSSSPVVITANTTVGGIGVFSSWLQFGGGKISSKTLTVPSGGASLAIAFYGIPVPDPCAWISVQIDNIQPWEFPTYQMYLNALHGWEKQLHDCQLKYGEI